MSPTRAAAQQAHPSHGRALEVVRAFIRSINRGRTDQLAALATENHVFTDSLGNKVSGSEAMCAAFAGYFLMVPDYRIEITQAFVEGNTVVLLGTASGSYVAPARPTPVGKWRMPAAWRAVVRKNRIDQWQVYADNEPIRKLMRQVTSPEQPER